MNIKTIPNFGHIVISKIGGVVVAMRFPKHEDLWEYLMDGRHGDWSGKPDAFDH